jgi:hypothetical protein
MKIGKKFDALSTAISENASYKLNNSGMELINQYHTIISQIEKSVLPILQNITKDPSKIAKQTAIQCVSTINSSREGNETFDLMSRLDTLTNGGKTPIQGNAFTFNQNDKILQYLANV